MDKGIYALPRKAQSFKTYQFKSTVNSDSTKQSKKSPKPQSVNLSLHFLFQIKI